MKKNARTRSEDKSMESRNCLAILALVTEMARQLNENISKIQLKPLDAELATLPSAVSALASTDIPAA